MIKIEQRKNVYGLPRDGEGVLIEGVIKHDRYGNIYVDISKTYNDYDKMYIKCIPSCDECCYRMFEWNLNPCNTCGDNHRNFNPKITIEDVEKENIELKKRLEEVQILSKEACRCIKTFIDMSK